MKKERSGLGFVLLRLVAIVMVVSVADAKTQFNVTRHYQGDVFSVVRGSCPADLCFAHERRAVKIPWAACECQCSRSSPVFRQDLEQCVSTIRECGQHTASFVGPSFSENVPLIFLPRKDGLIYPTAEVSLTDPTFKAVGPNICVLKELRMLGETGWEIVEALTNDGPSFKAVGGSGKLFLQFSGSDEMRQKLFGNVVVVSVVCHKDLGTSQHLTVPQVVGEYCIAFRVAHLPGYGLLDAAPPGRGSDYVIIGLCAGLLGVTYVGAVLIYLLVRWQRRYKENRKNSANNEENPAGENGRIPGKSVTSNGHVVASSEIGPTTLDPQSAQLSNDSNYEACQPGLERAPFKGLHVETIANGSATQGSSAAETPMQPSSVQRRRLYFDPSFLEADVLHSPPPAAVEFLQRIREMIAVTTARIRNNRFLPSLLSIPEESQFVLKSKSLSPRPPARKNSAKGKSTKEGIENEAFSLDEEEEERLDEKTKTNPDSSKNHIYSWIADEENDDEENAINKNESDKAKAEDGGAESMPFALNPSAGAVEDDDRFMFLARIPEDGELTDSFDGLYDFESFRQEMVKKMQKKRRNQMKPNGSGPTLDVSGELSENMHNEDSLSDDWADYSDDKNMNLSKSEENKSQPDSLDLLKSSDSSVNTSNSAGSSTFPKVSRIQILQRMFQGENSDNSASDKSDSDSSFDSIPATNDGKCLINDEELSKNENIPHNEIKMNSSPKASNKPLATYLFGETLLKVAKCQDKDDGPNGFYDKNSDKYANSSPAPPKIERLKRKSIGTSNTSTTLDSPVWSKGRASANQSRDKADKLLEEPHYSYPASNMCNESKPYHKQVVMVNGHNDIKLDCPSQDNAKTPTALINGTGVFDGRLHTPRVNVAHTMSNSANPISNQSRENIYDVPNSLPSSDSSGKSNGLKHVPEDSGYQSSDSDQSNKGMTNRFGNKMKSLRKLLTISPTKLDDPLLHNTNSSYDHNWSSGEGMGSYFLKYGANIQDSDQKTVNSAYTNGSLIPKIVSTLESTMDLGTEDEEEYRGNSSDSEYADSLDGSTAVR